MNMIMFDLETLSTEPNAAIASIGLVVFNEKEVIDKVQLNVDIESSINAGLHVSGSTLKWWFKQDKKAIDPTFNDPNILDLKRALGVVTASYYEYECEDVYGNGSIADIQWLNSAYKAIGKRQPWNYYNEMCYRTIRRHLPAVEFDYVGTSHVAVDDAENQARYLIKVMRKHGLWK